MKIIIDTDVLEKEKLEVKQYSWLYLQFIGELEKSWMLCPIFPSELLDLEKEHFIKILAIPNGANPKIALRDRTFSLFEVDHIDQKFNDFWGTFPIKVPDGAGGYRPLRTRDIGTKDYDEAKKKYIALIRFTPGMHEKIMKGLTNQLISQKHKLQYMNHIIAWLNQRIWERFADLDISDTEEKVTGI